MNFVDMHIGDYAEATGHLSALEDGIYWRMLRKYYATEKPLPYDVEKIQRLVGARAPEEIAAVQSVLADFFRQEADGWHQDRCDQVIADYKAGEPDRLAKKQNEETRSDRHRLERRRLFEVLNSVGIHAAWNIGMRDLRALAVKNCGEEAIRNATNPIPQASPVTLESSQVADGSPCEVTAPATAPATPATEPLTPVTANHSPLPTNHYPIYKDTPLPPKGAVRVRLDPDAEPEGFGPWYALYRRKDAKRDAIKAWRQLNPDAGLQARMVAATKAWPWAEDRTKIPLPASWLRGRRWEDEAVATGAPTLAKTAAGKAYDPLDWVKAAGFTCIDEAHNFGCNPVNFGNFKDGRRTCADEAVSA